MNEYILAADIGATKTDIGLFQRKDKVLERISGGKFKSCAEDEFLRRIKDFTALEMPRGKLSAACFGVAGPVINGRVVATNLGLELEEKKLRRELACDSLQLVNDLVATAAALPELTRADILSLQTGSARAGEHNETVAILAPGTGLGMAFTADRRYLKIISSEGGHVDFAPRNEDEVELWRYLREKFGRASRERILSGPGLVNIYAWLRQSSAAENSTEVLADGFSGADVVADAVAGDVLANRSLNLFTSIMGAVAGDLVLTGMAAGGLYLAGGIPAKIVDFLTRGQFIAAFNAKGRMSSWIEQVPVRVVLNPEAALIGAARIALERILPAF